MFQLAFTLIFKMKCALTIYVLRKYEAYFQGDKNLDKRIKEKKKMEIKI